MYIFNFLKIKCEDNKYLLPTMWLATFCSYCWREENILIYNKLTLHQKRQHHANSFFYICSQDLSMLAVCLVPWYETCLVTCPLASAYGPPRVPVSPSLLLWRWYTFWRNKNHHRLGKERSMASQHHQFSISACPFIE